MSTDHDEGCWDIRKKGVTIKNVYENDKTRFRNDLFYNNNLKVSIMIKLVNATYHKQGSP